MIGNHPGLLVGVPIGLFAVAFVLDRLETWMRSLWSSARHRHGEALSLAVGPAVAIGFALAVILLAVLV